MLSAAPPPLRSLPLPPPQSPLEPSLPPFSRRSRHLPSKRSRRCLPCSRSSSSTIQGVQRSPTPTPLPALERGAELREEPSSEPFPTIRAAKRVILVRHGQSTWNEEGRIQGSSDISMLTPKGEAQAETSRQMLLGDSFDVCFTSPLARSKKTAEIIWGFRKEQMIQDSDLREIDLYSFQGLLKHEGKQKFGQAYRQWQIDPANFCIDGHYPVRELWARARNCWNKILAHEGNSVLVVAHNAVNQALVATSLGLSTKYFRILLQSNCGVTVLDFTPRFGDRSPHISLNRLNQTPNSPVVSGSSGGRKTGKRMILVSHGVTQRSNEGGLRGFGFEPLNMLGVIQSQKTAELLLDVKVDSIICSPRVASLDTATAISEIQEAADCLGADCLPRNVEMKQLPDLEIESILQGKANTLDGLLLHRADWLSDLKEDTISDFWTLSDKVWRSLLLELSSETIPEKTVVVVAHPAVHIALIGQCLKLKKENMGYFHLDHGSVSVLDFPDGASGRGVVRCVNYTAHLGRWSIPVTRSTANDEEF